MPTKDNIRMSEAEIREYLQEGHTMTLITNGPKGYPHAVAMSALCSGRQWLF